MKNITYIIGLLAFVFSSCSDFLDEDNRSNAIAEEVYLTADGFESLVVANYSQLRGIYGQEAFIFCSGTDMYAQGRDPEPEGLATYVELNPNSVGVDQLYTSCYEAIRLANTAVYYGEITEQTDNLPNLLGQVKYLRANAYFLLVQTYGGVPLVTEFIDEPILSYTRDSDEDIYAFIIEELEEALGLVEDVNFTGRVTRRSVLHLLSKVYLTRAYESFGPAEDFSTAATLADQAINGQTLNLSFAELWAPENDLNEEVLFSVQYSAASVATDPTGLGHRQSTYFGPYQGGSEVVVDGVVTAPNRSFRLCPTEYAIRLFTQEDERWSATFMERSFTSYFDFFRVDEALHDSLKVAHYYAPLWASSTADTIAWRAADPERRSDAVIHTFGSYDAGAEISTDYETIPTKKFDDPTAPYGGTTSTRDIILSRLGETYLLAAEAYLGAGDPATGLDRLNVVRSRAGVADATLAEFNIDYILDERGRELLGEYHRWFDLKRTGTLVERAVAHHFLIEDESAFAGNNGEQKILRPIPQSAIDLNQNREFEQNPAYD